LFGTTEEAGNYDTMPCR